MAREIPAGWYLCKWKVGAGTAEKDRDVRAKEFHDIQEGCHGVCEERRILCQETLTESLK